MTPEARQAMPAILLEKIEDSLLMFGLRGRSRLDDIRRWIILEHELISLAAELGDDSVQDSPYGKKVLGFVRNVCGFWLELEKAGYLVPEYRGIVFDTDFPKIPLLDYSEHTPYEAVRYKVNVCEGEAFFYTGYAFFYTPCRAPHWVEDGEYLVSVFRFKPLGPLVFSNFEPISDSGNSENSGKFGLAGAMNIYITGDSESHMHESASLLMLGSLEHDIPIKRGDKEMPGQMSEKEKTSQEITQHIEELEIFMERFVPFIHFDSENQPVFRFNTVRSLDGQSKSMVVLDDVIFGFWENIEIYASYFDFYREMNADNAYFRFINAFRIQGRKWSIEDFSAINKNLQSEMRNFYIFFKKLKDAGFPVDSDMELVNRHVPNLTTTFTESICVNSARYDAESHARFYKFEPGAERSILICADSNDSGSTFGVRRMFDFVTVGKSVENFLPGMMYECDLVRFPDGNFYVFNAEQISEGTTCVSEYLIYDEALSRQCFIKMLKSPFS
jgi:hypothetical protein